VLGVISGFSIVWIIILVGMFIGRTGVLGERAQPVLSRLAFFVASPALLLETLSQTDLRDVFSGSLLIAAVSALVTGVLFFLVARLWLKRDTPESLMGGVSASLVNSANLGLPIAAYVLGNAALVAPVLIFQLAFYSPLHLMLMDSTTSRHRTTPVTFLVQIVRNPIIIGSMIGLLLAATGWTLPELVMEPIRLIGGAAIPAMLLAFGVSLYGSRPLRAADGRRLDVFIASVFKLVLQPLLAYLLAAFILGLEGHELFTAVVLAALPTAQNVFVAAARYDRGVVVAKDTVLVTTVVAIPALMAVAALLA
jgi:malonate transporter and related proteins